MNDELLATLDMDTLDMDTLTEAWKRITSLNLQRWAGPWCVPDENCWCHPYVVHTDPVNGGQVWAHREARA